MGGKKVGFGGKFRGVKEYLMTIPAWNPSGVLPPIRPTAQGHSTDRSPYVSELVALIDRFATSPQRIAILSGMLKFREALHQVGIVNGFQWFDGSFIEDVETLEGRPPNDLDVVTFFHLPAGYDQASLVQKHPTLFDPLQLKANFSMDAYPVVLGSPMNELEVRIVAYWYSMWSHRRSGMWKGFVQVSLDPAQDTHALALLNLRGGLLP